MTCDIMEGLYAPCMGRPTQRVELVAGEREALEALRKRQRSARSLAFRAGIILGCATGSNDKEVAKQLRTTNWTVGFWRKRFNRGRLEALYDEPRVGAPRSISDQRVEEVITKTQDTSCSPHCGTSHSASETEQAAGRWRTTGAATVPAPRESTRGVRDSLLSQTHSDRVWPECSGAACR